LVWKLQLDGSILRHTAQPVWVWTINPQESREIPNGPIFIHDLSASQHPAQSSKKNVFTVIISKLYIAMYTTVVPDNISALYLQIQTCLNSTNSIWIKIYWIYWDLRYLLGSNMNLIWYLSPMSTVGLFACMFYELFGDVTMGLNFILAIFLCLLQIFSNNWICDESPNMINTETSAWKINARPFIF
jgi:hypothetical protein